MLGNYNQALKYAKYYLSIAKELGDKEQEGRAYRYLISPISNLIKDGELIVVPDGPLCLAPFAAFLDSESKYLSESMRIRILPSLMCMKLIHDFPEDYHQKSGALLVGDPCLEDYHLARRE